MFNQLKNQYLKEETSYAQEEFLSMKMLTVDSDEITKHFNDRSSFQYEIIQPPDKTVESASQNTKYTKKRSFSSYARQEQKIHQNLQQKIQEIRQSSNKYEEIAAKFEQKGQQIQDGILTKKLKNTRRIKGVLEERKNKDNDNISNQVIDAYLRGDHIEIEGAKNAERFLQDEYSFNCKRNKHFQASLSAMNISRQGNYPEDVRNKEVSQIISISNNPEGLANMNNTYLNNKENNDCYSQERVNSLAFYLPTAPSPLSIRISESPISQTTNSPCFQDKSHGYFSKFSQQIIQKQSTKSNLPQIQSPLTAKPPIPKSHQKEMKSKQKLDLPRQRLVFQELLNQVDKVKADCLDNKENNKNSEKSLYLMSSNSFQLMVSKERNELTSITSQRVKEKDKKRIELQQQQQQNVSQINCNRSQSFNAKTNIVSSIASSKSAFNKNINDSTAICQRTITDQNNDDGQCSPKNSKRNKKISRFLRDLTVNGQVQISSGSQKQQENIQVIQELLLKNQKINNIESTNQGDVQKIQMIPTTANLLRSQQQQQTFNCNIISKELGTITTQDDSSQVKSLSLLEKTYQNDYNINNNYSQGIVKERLSSKVKGNIIPVADSTKSLECRQRSNTTVNTINSYRNKSNSKVSKVDALFNKSVREAAALAERSRQRSSIFQFQQEELMNEDTLADAKNKNISRNTRNRQSRILQNYQATRAPLNIQRKIDKEFKDILDLCVHL